MSIHLRASIQRFFYSALYYCLTPLLFARLLIKHKKTRAYRAQRQALRLAERLAYFSYPPQQLSPIWLHTVSVGEFIAALPLIKRVQQDYPHYPLIISCTTTTGSAQIIKTFADDIARQKILHVYLPYDLPGAMQRFFCKLKPCLGIIMETEIWPNMLHQAQQMDIPLLLLNARMSARSARGYQRISALTQVSLAQFSEIAAQDILDAERLIKLGADKDTTHVTGSIKFDIQLNPDDRRAGELLRQQLNWQHNKVLIAASTHQGEDEIILDIYQQLQKKQPLLRLIIVPRHPERFQAVYKILSADKHVVQKRSMLKDYNLNDDPPVDILLGDSMGEMMRYYYCADIVFMGGTLVPTGGHNILEPAALGLPIVYGPHMFNFKAISESFLMYQAALQVTDKAFLQQALTDLLADDARTASMAAQAKKLVQQNSGAVEKMMTLIKAYLP